MAFIGERLSISNEAFIFLTMLSYNLGYGIVSKNFSLPDKFFEKLENFSESKSLFGN